MIKSMGFAIPVRSASPPCISILCSLPECSQVFLMAIRSGPVRLCLGIRKDTCPSSNVITYSRYTFMSVWIVPLKVLLVRSLQTFQ